MDSADGFVRKHWLGQYSFPRSFWLHTVLLAWLIPIAALSVLSSNNWGFPARTSSVAFLVIFLVFYPALFWAMCGTLRASRPYVEKGGKRIWVSAALWLTMFLLMDSVFFFLGTRNIVIDHIRMALTGRYGPPVAISVVNSGTGLLLTGELREGSAEAVEIAMKSSPRVTMIELDSKGGLLQEASLLAKIISQYGLDTNVRRECSSACTFVFLAGRRRCATQGARIGFHAASYVRDLSKLTSQTIADSQRDLYTKAGLPASFVNEIIETPSRSVWYPSPLELLEAHVTTQGCP